jgi:hypothetical protein
MKKIQDQLCKEILKINDLRVALENSHFAKTTEAECYFNSLSTNVRFEFTDYEKFKEALALRRKEVDEPIKCVQNFYSCGRMHFIFHSKYIDLWYDCYIDDIPKELLPSQTCKVEKFTATEDDYRIVCEVK